MSRLLCNDDDNRKRAAPKPKENITDKEIYEVIESCCKTSSDKPSTTDLYDRIEDLQFELECCQEDSKAIGTRIQALTRLLEAIDVDRFQGDNKVYLMNILKKIKQLLS